MRFYNVLDEQGRFKGLKVSLNGIGQVNSHDESYLSARRSLEQQCLKRGIEFGLGAEDTLDVGNNIYTGINKITAIIEAACEPQELNTVYQSQ